ncbi:hypothetical protein ADUPG1_011188, partial [Aduncisulcus paluster]
IDYSADADFIPPIHRASDSSYVSPDLIPKAVREEIVRIKERIETERKQRQLESRLMYINVTTNLPPKAYENMDEDDIQRLKDRKEQVEAYSSNHYYSYRGKYEKFDIDYSKYVTRDDLPKVDVTQEVDPGIMTMPRDDSVRIRVFKDIPIRKQLPTIFAALAVNGHPLIDPKFVRINMCKFIDGLTVPSQTILYGDPEDCVVDRIERFSRYCINRKGDTFTPYKKGFSEWDYSLEDKSGIINDIFKEEWVAKIHSPDEDKLISKSDQTLDDLGIESGDYLFIEAKQYKFVSPSQLENFTQLGYPYIHWPCTNTERRLIKEEEARDGQSYYYTAARRVNYRPRVLPVIFYYR